MPTLGTSLVITVYSEVYCDLLNVFQVIVHFRAKRGWFWESITIYFSPNQGEAKLKTISRISEPHHTEFKTESSRAHECIQNQSSPENLIFMKYVSICTIY